MTKYCGDLTDLPGFPGCCTACHEDINEGHGDYQGPDGYCLCCRVADWFEKRVSSADEVSAALHKDA